MKLKGFRHFGGKDPATASLRKVLAWRGVVAPHTGKPLSEELLFGIGGGIGAGYFVVQYGGGTGFALGTRHLWHDHLAYLKALCMRLGVLPTVKEASGPGPALDQLTETLQPGKPAICWLDPTSLPYYAYPERWRGAFTHVAVVFGHDLDKDEVWISDIARRGLCIRTAELRAAREAVESHRCRILSAEPPHALPDLRRPVRDGIRACYEELLSPPFVNFGIDSLKHWGLLVGNRKLQEGWTKLFKPGPRLLYALTWTYRYIEHLGSGGGGRRGMYATFLDEAGELLEHSQLTPIAAMYRACAERWTDIATAALPDSVPLLKETRALIAKRTALLRDQGTDALPELEKIQKRLNAIEEKAADFPLSKRESAALLADLSARILELYEAECEALSALASVVR